MQQREMNDAEKMVRSLCVQDESQLRELFFDMIAVGGLGSVEKLFCAADEFLADYEPNNEIIECNGLPDEEDYKQVDDAQRAREAKAINMGRF